MKPIFYDKESGEIIPFSGHKLEDLVINTTGAIFRREDDSGGYFYAGDLGWTPGASLLDINGRGQVYISGPMTGIEDINREAFFAAEEKLKAMGYHVTNPARAPKLYVWANYMIFDLLQLMECTHICYLPGWENSTGAQIERKFAEKLGLIEVELE